MPYPTIVYITNNSVGNALLTFTIESFDIKSDNVKIKFSGKTYEFTNGLVDIKEGRLIARIKRI